MFHDIFHDAISRKTAETELINGQELRQRFKRRSKPYRGQKRKKVCSLCEEKIIHLDYKDIPRLKKNLSERAKILPRRVTGACAKHQRQLTEAVKRARHIALIPYITD